MLDLGSWTWGFLAATIIASLYAGYEWARCARVHPFCATVWASAAVFIGCLFGLRKLLDALYAPAGMDPLDLTPAILAISITTLTALIHAASVAILMYASDSDVTP